MERASDLRCDDTALLAARSRLPDMVCVNDMGKTSIMHPYGLSFEKTPLIETTHEKYGDVNSCHVTCICL